GAHFSEASREGLWNVDEADEPVELVTRHRKAQAVPPVAQRLLQALVHELMIDTAVGTLHLRLLQQLVGSEIDRPIFARALLRDRASRRCIERRPRFALGHHARTAIGRSVRTTSNARFSA